MALLTHNLYQIPIKCKQSIKDLEYIAWKYTYFENATISDMLE